MRMPCSSRSASSSSRNYLFVLIVLVVSTSTTTVHASDQACNNELNLFGICLGTNLSPAQTESCVACFQNSLPTVATTCSEIESTFCSNFETCAAGCGECYDEAIAYFDCAIDLNPVFPDCDVDCPGFEPPGVCADQQNAASACVSNLFVPDQYDCLSCYRDSFPPYGFPTCFDRSNQFCGNFDACLEVCGMCSDELVHLYSCEAAIPGCTIGCPNVEDTPENPAICPDELSRVTQCSAKELTLQEAESCASCFQLAVPSEATTCQDFETEFCINFEGCVSTCGPCFEELVHYYHCWVDVDPNFPDCDLACPNLGIRGHSDLVDEGETNGGESNSEDTSGEEGNSDDTSSSASSNHPATIMAVTFATILSVLALL